MGTVYCGPYADAIGYDDHEGHAARLLPDGTETSTWTYATCEFHGYRAHCACGWRAAAVHPATDAGEEAALDDWDSYHLRPLIQKEARRHNVPADVLLHFTRELLVAPTYTVDERGRERLTERSRGLVYAVEQLEHLLDDLAQQSSRDRSRA
jgi:hypothetical protein